MLCFTAEGTDKIVKSIGLDYQSLDLQFVQDLEHSSLDFYFYRFSKNATQGGDGHVTESLDTVNSASVSIGYFSKFVLLQ